ncbi:COP-coated vesicle membrane protein erv25 precursor, putative [Trypanosoma brucei brucei TREU927]|uniref:COP-coated vesicle membrane protein erv25, putative n=1 Tax=Trypanosoma brucei brucei (strain 927/4 GUTat10.1) TaxID=185431 RepID=Q38AU2_TRYB2|nr:COP-coated vesicle membrane protein Erv25 precursor [Trypanosoma brucei brucei TREU927]EAN78078.1 COP-coated vesicle membrane protein erv25 precursor, putative [Trypanosoma brucei brucei TREU927]
MNTMQGIMRDLRMVMSPFLLVLVVAISTPASAARFLLQNTQPICFVEEVGEDTRFLTGVYTRSDSLPYPPTVKMTIKSPSGSVTWEGKVVAGTNSFSAPVSAGSIGKYQICVSVSTWGFRASDDGSSVVMDVNIDQKTTVISKTEVPMLKRQNVGGMEVFTFRDFGGQQKDILRPPEYFKRVEGALSKLLMQVKDVSSGIDHNIERFSRMFTTSENTHKRIWAFGVLTVLVTIATIWLQFRLLKSTLREKKLV